MRYNFTEIIAAFDGVRNHAVEWDALQFGTVFCSSPDNCQSHAQIDGSDPADPVPMPPAI